MLFSSTIHKYGVSKKTVIPEFLFCSADISFLVTCTKTQLLSPRQQKGNVKEREKRKQKKMKIKTTPAHATCQN